MIDQNFKWTCQYTWNCKTSDFSPEGHLPSEKRGECFASLFELGDPTSMPESAQRNAFCDSWPRGVRSTLPLTAPSLFSASRAFQESISKQFLTENWFHTFWLYLSALRPDFCTRTLPEHAYDSCWCLLILKRWYFHRSREKTTLQKLSFCKCSQGFSDILIISDVPVKL